ncbi:MAG: DUF6125 family protein [Archaeoglobaceae archaeon]|nr:DUF6125 family protein [Archaeoglobaceae archaeon]MDW7989398.1 DUF6125 family protein [Archaeoglobaceae archaeon]
MSEYEEFLLRQLRLVDALWFLAVEDTFGLEAAVKLNEKIWEEIGSRSAREIKKRFKVEERGLEGFEKAIKYFPWCRILNYEFEKLGKVLRIRVKDCLPQSARIKMGRRIFPCREMHLREFRAFAKEVDYRIEVRCIYAPPEIRDYFCVWEFELMDIE